MWHFPDAQFKYRSDVTREVRTLQQEYLRRAALQQRKPLEGKDTKTILEEALQLIKAHQDVKYRLQPHSYAPGQPQRFFVSDGSESKWLPAGDWEIKVFNVAQGAKKYYVFDKQGKRSIWLHDLFPQEGPQPDRNAMLQSAIEDMLASYWPGQSPNSPGMQTSVASPSTPHGSPASAHFVLPSDHSAPGLEEQTVQAHGPQPRPMTIGESHLQAQAHAQHNEPSMLPQPQPPDNPDATIHRHPDGRIFLHSESRMSTRWLHRTSSNGADDYEVFKSASGVEYVASRSSMVPAVFVQNLFAPPPPPPDVAVAVVASEGPPPGHEAAAASEAAPGSHTAEEADMQSHPTREDERDAPTQQSNATTLNLKGPGSPPVPSDDEA